MLFDSTSFLEDRLFSLWRLLSAIFGYEITTGHVCDVAQLRANKRSKTGSGMVFDISGQKFRLLRDMQFTYFMSYESERLGLGTVSGSGGSPRDFLVDQTVLDDQKLLYKRDAG